MKRKFLRRVEAMKMRNAVNLIVRTKHRPRLMAIDWVIEFGNLKNIVTIGFN